MKTSILCQLFGHKPDPFPTTFPDLECARCGAVVDDFDAPELEEAAAAASPMMGGRS